MIGESADTIDSRAFFDSPCVPSCRGADDSLGRGDFAMLEGRDSDDSCTGSDRLSWTGLVG